MGQVLPKYPAVFVMTVLLHVLWLICGNAHVATSRARKKYYIAQIDCNYTFIVLQTI